MKYRKAFFMMAILCSVVWLGCEQQQIEPAVDSTEVNRKVVDTYSDLAIQNAIIAQHTLYPYHFVNNSTQLNKLGQRDLTVLIQHFKDNPGKLNVEQGGVDSVLYQSRAKFVYERMLAEGIPDSNIRIAGGMPGGEGMSSKTVIEIIDKALSDKGNKASGSSTNAAF